MAMEKKDDISNSKTFISSKYIQESVLSNHKSFYDNNDQEYSLQSLSYQLSASNKLMMSSAEGSIFVVTMIKDGSLIKLLICLQNALSSYLATNDLSQFTTMIRPTF
jgi:hypothetical protein